MTGQAFDYSSPQVLGDRYQTQQLLGKKAGRQTWLAQDLQTQDLVVVKLLTFSSDFSWDDLKLFEREAETLRSLSHPAIPRYLDYFELDLTQSKGFALVQTYIDARSLEQHLKAGRSFNEAEVKQLAKDLLGILTYLHDRQPRVIHRDIKPSNILLTNRSGNSPGQVYLVDFGSVQTLAAREGSTVTVVGTYGYMPPEQFGGRSSPASDLYSLGATLICLVTGQHPADLPQTDLRIEFEQAATLSPTFTSWLKWITEPSLSKRPASAQQALQGLEQAPRTAKVTEVVQGLKPVSPPTHTRISLSRYAKSLEIGLPSHYLIVSRQWTIAGIALVVFFSFYALLWFVGRWILSAVLSPVRRTRLRIDPRHLSITRELFGMCYGEPISVPRQDIWKLELALKSGTFSHQRNPVLFLWAGTRRCEIRGSRAELEWLAYELSDWLNLPVTVSW